MDAEAASEWASRGWCADEPPTALEQLQLESDWCANCMIAEGLGEDHADCAGWEGYVCGCHECEAAGLHDESCLGVP